MVYPLLSLKFVSARVISSHETIVARKKIRFQWNLQWHWHLQWLVSSNHFGSAHTTPEKFENSFILTDWPTVLMDGRLKMKHHHPKAVRFDQLLWITKEPLGAYRKRSSSPRNLKTTAFRFRADGKRFENGAFRKRCSHDHHVISLIEFSTNTNKK